MSRLVNLEAQLGDLSRAKVPSRIFKLPIIFDSPRQTAALQRYMETQRPYASYLPDNMKFVAKNNGLERKDLEKILTTAKLMAVSVGFFAALPLCLPVDPRQRLNCPKVANSQADSRSLIYLLSLYHIQMNPSRVFTPEGQVSWGGSCMALYNVESPGGYQMTGLTIPGVDILGSKTGYSLQRPWLFEDFDQLTFHEVSEPEYERQLALFHSGRYEYEVEECIFDMAEHNEFLEATKAEVEEIRKKQRKAQEEMDVLEKRLMDKWSQEKAAGKIPIDKVEALLNGRCPRLPSALTNHLTPTTADPTISPIPSPLNANVWKIATREGDTLDRNGAVVAILEAMKLEISVRAEEELAGGKVEKVLVRPNDVVKAGDPLVLVRRVEL